MSKPHVDIKDQRLTLNAVRRFEEAIARNPKNVEAYLQMGRWWHTHGAYAQALDLYDKAIALDARFADALCARAQLHATCPEAMYRNGPAAVRDATAALAIAEDSALLKNDWQWRMYLQTLAAAHAENANFESAIEVQRSALDYARTRVSTVRVQAALLTLESRRCIRGRSGFSLFGCLPESEADDAAAGSKPS